MVREEKVPCEEKQGGYELLITPLLLLFRQALHFFKCPKLVALQKVVGRTGTFVPVLVSWSWIELGAVQR